MKSLIKKWPLVLPIIVLVGLGVWANNNKELHNEVELQTVDSTKVDKLLADPGVFVLDVHTPEQKHLEGTDAFIPFDQIEENMDRLPTDKETPILVYCRSGNMSREAGEQLVQMGYTNVTDLIGGVKAYWETHVGAWIEPEELDLGEVSYEKGAELSFWLVNNTPVEMTVTRLTGSCACTQPSMKKLMVPAYESEEIKVKFVPSVHDDDSDLGYLTRTIFVETDNPNFAKMEAEFSATVVKN